MTQTQFGTLNAHCVQITALFETAESCHEVDAEAIAAHLKLYGWRPVAPAEKHHAG
jgi:hypothetical protein